MQDDSRDAYTEVGGRATQDAKAEGGGTPPWMEKVRLHGSNRYDPKDGGGRVALGAATESRAGSGDREQRRTPTWT